MKGFGADGCIHQDRKLVSFYVTTQSNNDNFEAFIIAAMNNSRP